MTTATARRRGATNLTPKGQATRERIVGVAAELMFARGIAATSVEDILAAAEVGTSQLYHYFGDKQGLIRAVISHQADATIARQRPLLDQLDSLQALREWRDGVVRRQQQKGCVGGCTVGSLAAQLVETQPEVRPDLASAFRRWEDPIQRGLQAMKDRGALRSEADPAQLALGLLAALQGGLLLSQTARSTTALESALDCMISYIASLATDVA